ncbi:MAG: hypothetical protein AAGA54_35090 [Myxococcota bacterium]
MGGWRRWAWAGLLSALPFAVPSTASAKPAPMPGSGDIGGRGRIAFDLEAAYWQGTVLTPEVEGELWLRQHTGGVFGYRRIPGGFSAAFALNEWVAVGARADWAVEPGVGQFTIRGGFAPFAQVFFGRDRNVRPFALLRAGFGRSNTFQTAEDSGLRTVGPRTLYPRWGGGFGAHVFITEAISFDALAAVDQRWNLVRPLAEAGSEPDAASASWRYQDTTISTSLTFGFSQWF